MNPLDILIIVFVASGIGWGLYRGLIRSLICLITLYVMASLSLAVYTTVAGWIGYLMTSFTSSTRRQTEGISFLLVLVLGTVILNALTKRYFPETRLSGKVFLDRFSGLVLGLALAAFWIVLIMPPIEYLLTLPTNTSPSLRFFYDSVMMEWVYVAVPYVMTGLRPWLAEPPRPEMFGLH
jgi:uncharacterized membrane protein required for colicin V production